MIAPIAQAESAKKPSAPKESTTDKTAKKEPAPVKAEKQTKTRQRESKHICPAVSGIAVSTIRDRLFHRDIKARGGTMQCPR